MPTEVAVRTILLYVVMGVVLTLAAYGGLVYLDRQEKVYWSGFVTKYQCEKTNNTRDFIAMIPIYDAKGNERGFVPDQIVQTQWKCAQGLQVWK